MQKPHPQATKTRSKGIILVVVLVAALIVVWQLSLLRDSSYDPETDQIVAEMITINPNMAKIERMAFVKASEEKRHSLGNFVGTWGVVLSDGQVVLTPFQGTILWDSTTHYPVQADFESMDDHAILIRNMELPEAWKSASIMVVQEDGTDTHFVLVTVVLGIRNGTVTEYGMVVYRWEPEGYYAEVDMSAMVDKYNLIEPSEVSPAVI